MDVFEIAQYKADIVALLESACIKYHFMSYVSDIIGIDCDESDILFLLNGWCAYLHDMTANYRDRDYSNLDDIVRDELRLYHKRQR